MLCMCSFVCVLIIHRCIYLWAWRWPAVVYQSQRVPVVYMCAFETLAGHMDGLLQGLVFQVFVILWSGVSGVCSLDGVCFVRLVAY